MSEGVIDHDLAAGVSPVSPVPQPAGSGQPTYTLTHKTSPAGGTEGDLLEVAMGPQHPSTHGVFRMDVALDGERVGKLQPVFGYLRRNHEKIAEGTTYLGSMPYTDRLDYLGWLEQAKQVVGNYPRFLDEFDRFLSENEILLARTQGVGVLSRGLAVDAGITGPMLRASGVNYDIRKVDKYGIYDRFQFRVPLGEHGDTYDRYMIRLLEMRESLNILQTALRDIPTGPIMDAKAKIRGFRPKPGEAYGRIEAPKGELGFYLISDGGPNPYRYRVRPPSLINLTVLEDMCLGYIVADVVVILGSVDIVLGEADR